MMRERLLRTRLAIATVLLRSRGKWATATRVEGRFYLWLKRQKLAYLWEEVFY